MTADHYAAAGRGWATSAGLVHGPIAAELIALSPHPLADHTVPDAGADTGAASRARAAQPARPIPMDLSFGMLAWDAAARPPGAVADIARCRWPPSLSTTTTTRWCSTTSPTPPLGSPSWPA
jgi:hypothetical protein